MTVNFQADLFLLCFAVDDRVSFENMETKWIPDLEEYSDVPIILLGKIVDR
jgi:GTPase SAR1 family protein